MAYTEKRYINLYNGGEITRGTHTIF